MENLKIEKTKTTPLINFDYEKHELLIQGESYPENTYDFYHPVFEWLNEYFSTIDENQKVTLNIDLIYFNSSSSKILLDIFDLFEDKAENREGDVIVNWYYDEENESAIEYGEEFKEDLDYVKFNLVKK